MRPSAFAHIRCPTTVSKLAFIACLAFLALQAGLFRVQNLREIVGERKGERVGGERRERANPSRAAGAPPGKPGRLGPAPAGKSHPLDSAPFPFPFHSFFAPSYVVNLAVGGCALSMWHIFIHRLRLVMETSHI